MTSHIKSSLLGSSISFPVKNGIPQLGTWQGVYLCEHRNNAPKRRIVITLIELVKKYSQVFFQVLLHVIP